MSAEADARLYMQTIYLFKVRARGKLLRQKTADGAWARPGLKASGDNVIFLRCVDSAGVLYEILK